MKYIEMQLISERCTSVNLVITALFLYVFRTFYSKHSLRWRIYWQKKKVKGPAYYEAHIPGAVKIPCESGVLLSHLTRTAASPLTCVSKVVRKGALRMRSIKGPYDEEYRSSYTSALPPSRGCWRWSLYRTMILEQLFLNPNRIPNHASSRNSELFMHMSPVL